MNTKKCFSWNGILYAMNGDGTVEVCQYRGNAGHVTIPENVQGYRVTGIDDIAFLNQRQVFRVQIPDSVTKIGRNAFRNCGIKTVVDEDLARAYTARSRRDLEEMFGYGYEYYEGRMMSGENPEKVVACEFTAEVGRNSYAEHYCRENGIRFAYR